MLSVQIYLLRRLLGVFSRLLVAASLCLPACRHAAAALSGAGEYSIESSVHDSGGGSVMSGGGYLSRGSAGQNLAGDGIGNSSGGQYVNRTGFYNPPRFTFQKWLTSVVHGGVVPTSMTLPPGSVDKEVFDITLNWDPASTPMSVSPGVIESANNKIEQNEGALARLFPGHITELALFDEQGTWDKPFIKSGMLSMGFNDSDGDGILDGSNPPVRVETFRTWALDESLAMWTKLPAAAVDHSSHRVSVSLAAPGVFALLGMVDESVKDTYAFPVPFRPNGPNAGTGAGQSGTEAEGITFTNIPQRGSIEIYTLDGRLVRKLEIPAGLVLPKIKWDARTSGGDKAASGVYIWRVVSGGNSKTGKLMIIR